MACSSSSSCCGTNPCTCNTCDPEEEPLASALNNFITSFYGSIVKTCVDNQVVWVLPCSLDDGIPGYPRVAGEGLACYFSRVFESITGSALIKVDGSDSTPGFLADKVVGGGGITLTILNPGGDEQLQIDTVTGAPGKVGVSAADTTIDFLQSKLSATGITFSITNPGANEVLNLTADGEVLISVADTTRGFVGAKITVGSGISKTIVNPGANETLNLVNTGLGLVTITGADTTPAVLNSKITVGPGLAKSTVNPGANEVLNITNAASSSIGASNIDWSLSNAFFKTLGANTAFTFSNETDSQSIVVAITNTAGNFTATWPAGVLWANASEPVLTLGAKTDVFTFVRINSILYGSVVQNMS